jgi:hypothetical protein
MDPSPLDTVQSARVHGPGAVPVVHSSHRHPANKGEAEMKFWKILMMTTALGLGLLAVTGCESDSVAPQETYDVDAESAQEWSLQAIEMINQMAASVPPAAEGDFSSLGPDNKSTGEPVWDEEQMAWILNETASFTEGDPPTSTGETRVAVWIQFRGAEGPLPSPLGATVMDYRESAGMTLHSEGEQGVSDLDFDLASTMVVTFLATGYDMKGSGNAEIDASVVAEDRSEIMNLKMSWGMDLVTLFEGCPTGTAYVQVGPFRTEVIYDGQGNANWVMAGPNHAASGTETVSCGAPM